MSDTTFEETIFEVLTDETGAAGDLSAGAQDREAGSFLRHAVSLSMTKIADGLIDPKLVLAWLSTHLGAPALLVGFLVPVREAGALLPQPIAAQRIGALDRRKWAWAAGSAVQGAAAGLIALAGLTLAGWGAGAAIVAALALLAVARSVCSASYKDVLGKTVGKTRRGAATGFASSAASVGVILFALALMTGIAPRYGLVIGALMLAAALWLVAAAVFATLAEEPAATTDPGWSVGAALGQMRLLRQVPQLGRFVVARGFLTATALAPPYLVLIASGAGKGAFARLGALVLASALAALVSAYIWGRLSDRSSRRVLMLAGLGGGAALGAALALTAAGLMGTLLAAPLALFVLMVAYHGVRQGRSTYLVDMAPAEERAAYTAVSNAAIGLILLAAGAIGAAAAMLGAWVAVALFAAMSLAGTAAARGLAEVEAP